MLKIRRAYIYIYIYIYIILYIYNIRVYAQDKKLRAKVYFFFLNFIQRQILTYAIMNGLSITSRNERHLFINFTNQSTWWQYSVPECMDVLMYMHSETHITRNKLCCEPLFDSSMNNIHKTPLNRESPNRN